MQLSDRSDAPWRPLSEDEHVALELEARECHRDYRPPIWGPMPSEHYRVLRAALHTFEAAQNAVDGYAVRVRLLRLYVGDLEALIAVEAPWLILSPALHLLRCMALGTRAVYVSDERFVEQMREAA